MNKIYKVGAKVFSNEDYSNIKKLFEKGETTVSIVRKYKSSEGTIAALRKEMGFKSLTQSECQKKYEVNQDFFDQVDTQEKAYILGLLYADGSVSHNDNNVALFLKESDKNILEQISKLIQPTRPLRYLDLQHLVAQGKFKKVSNHYILTIRNKQIVESLKRLGCVPRKALILTFPTEEQVPKHLQSHFIRGYFDGDGCIHNNKSNQKYFSILGTFSFLEEVQKIMVEKTGVKFTKITPTGKIANLNYLGNIQCKRIAMWLYEDAIMYLKRKKDIFDSIVHRRVAIEGCSIEGCEEKHHARDFCERHYKEHIKKLTIKP